MSSSHREHTNSARKSPYMKHIDHMPSHRNERRKQIYGSEKQLYSDVRPSTFITPYISTSTQKKFNIETHAGARSPPRLYRASLASGSNYFHPTRSPELRSPSAVPSAAVHPAIPSPRSSLPPSSPPSLSPPTPPVLSIEDDKFAYRCTRALKIAVAAEAAIETEETYLWARIREEELVLGMLHDEVEDTGSRRKAAIHQVQSIIEGARLRGVELPDVGELKHEARLSLGPGSPIPSPIASPGQLYNTLTVDVTKHSVKDPTESPKLSPLLSLVSLPPSPAHNDPQISQDTLGIQPSQSNPLNLRPTTPPPLNSITSALGAANGV